MIDQQFQRRKEHRDVKMEPDNYYKMPPVGMTGSRVKVDGIVRTLFTVRCGDKACWFVGNAAREQDAQMLLDNHECPTPPARNELPTGYSILDKMWDELDDATAALLEQREWRTGTQTLEGSKLQGYCRGIAFTLSMMTHPHFRTSDEVTREAVRRYKQHQGQVPHTDTPGYHGHNPMPSSTPRQANTDPSVISTKPAERQTPKRAPLKKATPNPMLKKIDMSSIDAATSDKIRMVDKTGMMKRDELAKIYGVTIETVNFLCDNKV